MPTATLTFSATVATSILAALGKTLNLKDGTGLPRDAMPAEYEDWLRDVTRRMVQGQQLKDSYVAVVVPTSIVIT